MLSDPKTLDKRSRALKKISAVAVFGPVICTVAVNLFLSALGNFFKKFFFALSSAAFAIFIASAIFIRNYEVFFSIECSCAALSKDGCAHCCRALERTFCLFCPADCKTKLYQTVELFALQLLL